MKLGISDRQILRRTVCFVDLNFIFFTFSSRSSSIVYYLAFAVTIPRVNKCDSVLLRIYIYSYALLIFPIAKNLKNKKEKKTTISLGTFMSTGSSVKKIWPCILYSCRSISERCSQFQSNFFGNKDAKSNIVWVIEMATLWKWPLMFIEYDPIEISSYSIGVECSSLMSCTLHWCETC